MIRIVRIVPSDKSRVLPLNKEVPRKVAAKNEYGMPRRGGTLEGVSVFLVLLLICQESPDQLVDRLGAGKAEDRAQAVQAIRALGEAARPALEKALRNPDTGLAERARALLAEIRHGLAEAQFQLLERALQGAASLRFRFQMERKEEGQENRPAEAGVVLVQGRNVLLHINPQGPPTQLRGLLVGGENLMSWRAMKPGLAPRDPPWDTALPDLGHRLLGVILSDGTASLASMVEAKDRLGIERLIVPQTVPLSECSIDGAAKTLSWGGDGLPTKFRSTLWFDPKTFSLIKRISRWKENSKEIVLTEHYSEWALNPAIPGDAFDSITCRKGVKFKLSFSLPPDQFRDGAPIGDDEPYALVLSRLARMAPETLDLEEMTVDYVTLARRPETLRAQPLRLRLLFLASYPTPLDRIAVGQDKVYRTYLADPTGSEGYVVDLLEPPGDLQKKTPVTLVAVFLRLASYEGQKGPVRAPFLVGRGLSVVKEK
jgi:hypothetical protein